MQLSPNLSSIILVTKETKEKWTFLEIKKMWEFKISQISSVNLFSCFSFVSFGGISKAVFSGM